MAATNEKSEYFESLSKEDKCLEWLNMLPKSVIVSITKLFLRNLMLEVLR